MIGAVLSAVQVLAVLAAATNDKPSASPDVGGRVKRRTPSSGYDEYYLVVIVRGRPGVPVVKPVCVSWPKSMGVLRAGSDQEGEGNSACERMADSPRTNQPCQTARCVLGG